MDVTNGAVWLALAIVLIIGVITKAVIGRNMPAPVCDRLLPPPVAHNGSIVMLLHAFLNKGFHAMIQDQYTKLGSVFTVSIFGLKATFLVGPEVSGQFFEGMPSEIGVSPALQFFEPILGKENYGIDTATHYWITGFMKDALKSGKLRSIVSPMIQEVEVMHGYTFILVLCCDD
jgi:sterol 14-demethylase